MTKSLVAIAFLICNVCYGQVVIKGKILDEKTKSPVPYASIGITNGTVGTATDERGDFLIKVNPEHQNEKLILSSLGFGNKMVSIDSLVRKANPDMILYMVPYPLVLEDVIVKDSKIKPEELLKEAIAAIPKNYIQTPFNLEFYSKMEVKDSSKTYYNIESVLRAYRKGYVAEAVSWSRILQKRETGVSPLSSLHPKYNDKSLKGEYFPFWPAPAINIDQVGSFGIFDPKRFNKMHFTYAGIAVFDRDTVMAIEYSPKKKDVKGTPGSLDGRVNGIIYIAVNNLAIIRHTLKVGYQRHDIIYKKNGSYYYPYLIQLEYGYHHYKIPHSLVLRDIKTTDVEVIENKPKNWHPEDMPYNKAYWDTTYPK
jgi:hypothetical protein